MNREFGLILIGDELLSGRRADKHLPKVIEMLGQRGLQLSWMHCLGDDPARIEAELKQVYERSVETECCVFCCGGIGSTPDDHTRQCAAKAFGVGLELHAEEKELILQRAQETALQNGEVLDINSEETRNRLEMGMFPRGARIIPNPYNKIPGFSFGDMYFFPGFSVMAWPMMEWVLEHYYAKEFKILDYMERSLVVYGREAALTQLMVEIEGEFAGVKVFSLPSVDHLVYGAHIELGVKGEERQVNQAFETMVKRLQAMGVRMGEEL